MIFASMFVVPSIAGAQNATTAAAAKPTQQDASSERPAPVVVEGRLITRTLDARGTITIGDGVIMLDHDGMWSAQQYTIRIGLITSIAVKTGLSKGTITLDCGAAGSVEIRARRRDAKAAGKQLRARVVEGDAPSAGR